MSSHDSPSEKNALKRLIFEAEQRGLPREEAEDVAMKLWLELYKKFPEKGPEERLAMALSMLPNRISDYRHSPDRIFSKRLNTALSRSDGEDRIVQWIERGVKVVGLVSQRHQPPVLADEMGVVNSRFIYFLTTPEGLGGDNPRLIKTEPLVVRFLQWLGAPAEKSLVVFMLAEVAVEHPHTSSDEDDTPAPPMKEPVNVRGMWEAILKLSSRSRGALLLSFDEGMLRAMRADFRQQLVQVIQGWRPPPPLEAIELPADDRMIANRLAEKDLTDEELDVEASNIRKLRDRAKETLMRKLWPLVDETLPPHPAAGGA